MEKLKEEYKITGNFFVIPKYMGIDIINCREIRETIKILETVENMCMYFTVMYTRHILF